MASLQTSDFSYDLPRRLIAQQPVTPRDSSRLMVLPGQGEEIEHAHFFDIGRYLNPRDVLVINHTRVIPARLFGHKIPTRGRVELLLLRREEKTTWKVMVGGRGMGPGQRIQVEGGPEAVIEKVLSGPLRVVKFSEPIQPLLDDIGHTPLPPYIHRDVADRERYQTVYADVSGSAAAPTAGLHFTPQLMADLRQQGIEFAEIILHVGLDTFAPVREEDPRDHPIHKEWCSISQQAVNVINRAREEGGRVVAVGTTSVRTLETAGQKRDDGLISPFEGETDLYILPGFQFQVVDSLITNFHLPESTLLMLVSAFAGRERILDAYQIAIQKGYRFYSFGDAMYVE